MKLTIQYTSQLALLTGVSEEEMEVATGTLLQTVIDRIVARHGEGVAAHFRDARGGLTSSLLVIVDGEQVTGDRVSRDVSGARTVLFMAPIAGG